MNESALVLVFLSVGQQSGASFFQPMSKRSNAKPKKTTNFAYTTNEIRQLCRHRHNVGYRYRDNVDVTGPIGEQRPRNRL